MAFRGILRCSPRIQRCALLGLRIRQSKLAGDTMIPRNCSSQANNCTKQEKIGLIYASNSGMTEEVAARLAKMIDVPARDIEDIKEATDLTQYDALIVGTPTHNTLEDKYRSGTGWDDIIDEIREEDFSGKKVAVFGLGDSNCYPEGFCDALEELHNTFQAAGASMVGYVDESILTYEHCASKSNIDGKFVGLPLDEMNEDDLTKEKLEAWIEQLKNEDMPL